MEKKTRKTYSPMDDDERKDRTQSTDSTIKCLRQGNINKLTQKTDREVKRRSNEKDTLFPSLSLFCVTLFMFP